MRSSASALRNLPFSMRSWSSSRIAVLTGCGQAAEGLLNLAYRADSMPGVDQQIAQLLVVLAETGADLGERQFASVLGNGPIAIGGRRCRGLLRGRNLARTKTGKH